jgi:hypothetical protein
VKYLEENNFEDHIDNRIVEDTVGCSRNIGCYLVGFENFHLPYLVRLKLKKIKHLNNIL